ncbi:Protein of uncharacterised function (DUF3296) [Yersinia pseudotuberculosis]|nr:Protein of uncharacterised function (DUF3296) [Yersinia pseudotuberculosis]SUQ38088.1 Protein of uncharacterised function (DUF3296) [Yersinia pseudotuberculosis]
MKNSLSTNLHYDINRKLLNNVNEYVDKLFEQYSKLLMLRVDLAYLKNSIEFKYQDTRGMSADVVQLLNNIQGVKGIVGHVWVMENTENHGLHIHMAIFFNGQIRNRVWTAFQEINYFWERVTKGNGYAHRCEPKKHYRVKGEQVINYHDKKGIVGMKYILSYLAKMSQKELGLIYRLSHVAEKPIRGRKRGG